MMTVNAGVALHVCICVPNNIDHFVMNQKVLYFGSVCTFVRVSINVL